MMNMTAVGRDITRLRKNRNMTQMELADLLMVSHQAVSNWERGVTLPDISKLPELAEILGVSIDTLLKGEPGAELVKSAAEGRMKEYVEGHEVTVAEFRNVAPLLKPDQIDDILSAIKKVDSIDDLLDILAMASEDGDDCEEGEENADDIEQRADDITQQTDVIDQQADTMTQRADVISQRDAEAQLRDAEAQRQDAEAQKWDAEAQQRAETMTQQNPQESYAREKKKSDRQAQMDELVLQAIRRGEDNDKLMQALPYVSREVADTIAYETVRRGSIKLRSYTPYIGREAAEMVARNGLNKNVNMNFILDILPFVGMETADRVAARALEIRCNRVTPFLAYVSRGMADRIAQSAAKRRDDTTKLRRCMAFVSQPVADALARELLHRKQGWLEDLAPFVSDECKRYYIENKSDEYGLVSRFVSIDRFFDKEYFDQTVRDMLEHREPADRIFILLPFVSRGMAEQAAERAMETGADRLYKFMPYVSRPCADRLALHSLERRNHTDRLAWLLPLFSRETVEIIARRLLPERRADFIDYAGFLSPELRDEMAERLYGMKSRGRMPFAAYDGFSNRNAWRQGGHRSGGSFFTGDFSSLVNSKIFNTLGKDFFGDLREQIKTGLQDELRDEIRDELRDEIRDELEDELRDEIKEELQEELGDEIIEELKDELREEIADELKNELRENINAALRNKDRGEKADSGR